MFILADASIPLPAPDRFGIPGHWALFLLLYHVTIVLHFLFMNFAVGGAVVCLVNDVRSLGPKNREYLADLSRRISKVIPIAISFLITFGVAPLLFVQVLYGQFFYTANVLVGLPWMGVIAILIVVFYLAHIVGFRRGRQDVRWIAVRIVISAAMVAGFAAVALLLTSNHVWSIVPRQWLARYHAMDYKPWPAEPHFWFRYAHNLIGATAVGCLLCAAVARTLAYRRLVDAAWVSRTIRGFLLAAFVLTLAQAGDGVMVLLWLPAKVREVMLLSPNWVHVWGWRVSILGAILACVFMVRGIRRPGDARPPWVALLLIVVTVTGMEMARQAIRVAYLQQQVGFDLSQWSMHWQVGPIILFLACFVGALALVAWMLWIGWRAGPWGTESSETASPPGPASVLTTATSEQLPPIPLSPPNEDRQ